MDLWEDAWRNESAAKFYLVCFHYIWAFSEQLTFSEHLLKCNWEIAIGLDLKRGRKGRTTTTTMKSVKSAVTPLVTYSSVSHVIFGGRPLALSCGFLSPPSLLSLPLIPFHHLLPRPSPSSLAQPPLSPSLFRAFPPLSPPLPPCPCSSTSLKRV